MLDTQSLELGVILDKFPILVLESPDRLRISFGRGKGVEKFGIGISLLDPIHSAFELAGKNLVCQ